MFFCPNVFLYAAIVVVAFLSMLMVGGGCVKLLPELYFGKNPLANVFVCLMTGYIAIVALFAIIVSRCNSVMLLSAVIVVYYVLFIRNKSGREENKRVIDKDLIKFSVLSIGLLLLIFFVCYYIFFIRSNGAIWCDFTFYSNVSCHLVKNHCENAELYSNMCNATRYHWGDLWLTSLFGSLFKANYLYVLLLVTYPCLTLICIVGGCSVLYGLTNRMALSIILGMGVLFAVPLLTIVIQWFSPVVIGSKLIVIYCFVVLSLLFYCNGRLKLSYISLLLLVPFYSTVAPGILTMVCVLSIIEERSKGEKWLQCVFNRVVLLSILVAVFYVVFYILQGIGGDKHLDFLYDDYVRNTVGFVIKRSCRALVLIPCVIGLCYLVKTNNDKESVSALYWIVAVLFGVVVSSIVGGCVKQVMLDGGQITTNYTEPVINITCWFMAVFLFSKIFPGKYVGLFALATAIVYVLLFILSAGEGVYVRDNRVYSDEEIDRIEAFRKEVYSNECAFGYYRNYNISENFNTQKSRINMFYPADMMPHLVYNGFYAPYCLSALDIPDNLEPRWNEKQKSELYKYMEQMKKDGLFSNEDELIMSFIYDKNVEFIVVENGCDLPDYLDGNVALVYDGSDKVYRLEKR